VTAVLERLWPSGGRKRNPTDLFGQADRLRREGRYTEAATLVTSGLALDPNSITGHLLAAYLHAAQRTIEPAKREFRWVLSRDPVHPRALLGLARLALEEGDLVGCRECLSSALRAYPDFPEARAVLDALTAASPTNATPTAAPARLERVRLPAAARALVVVDAQGQVLAERPEVEDAGPRLARIAGLAGAALQRAGFGPLRRAIIDDHEQTEFVRSDSTLTLGLALPRTTPIPQGLLEVNRLWGTVQHELAVTRDERAVPPPDGVRRVS
jgi:tetratricopeptide (TPR) repeat protein